MKLAGLDIDYLRRGLRDHPDAARHVADLTSNAELIKAAKGLR